MRKYHSRKQKVETVQPFSLLNASNLNVLHFGIINMMCYRMKLQTCQMILFHLLKMSRICARTCVHEIDEIRLICQTAFKKYLWQSSMKLISLFNSELFWVFFRKLAYSIITKTPENSYETSDYSLTFLILFERLKMNDYLKRRIKSRENFQLHWMKNDKNVNNWLNESRYAMRKVSDWLNCTELRVDNCLVKVVTKMNC